MQLRRQSGQRLNVGPPVPDFARQRFFQELGEALKAASPLSPVLIIQASGTHCMCSCVCCDGRKEYEQLSWAVDLFLSFSLSSVQQTSRSLYLSFWKTLI